MNATHTGDLLISFGEGKGYSMFRVEDCFNFNSAITSGVSIKMEPDLATRGLDLESIVKHDYLVSGIPINKIDILFKKIEKKND